MGDPKTVLEGTVKYRDRKKWKARWAVVSKLSPVADCLHLQLYRDSKERCKNGPTKASLSLQGFLGMETGFTLDKESNTMALICSELVVVLAFDSRELLIQWQVKIRANLAEEQQYLVQIATVPPKSKLACGPARLHLQDHIFSLVAGVPPRLLGTWPIKELRRFGVIEGKFCFEGGSLCGKGEGIHVLLTNQSEELSQAMTLASKGKLPGKRKVLSRKNSLLETSTRSSPIHKTSRRSTEKCHTSDSSRPLLSSGSECSTCDACSEILRCSDPIVGCDDTTYNSTASTKASSCRIHYRWPSCMSRWGHSSTITTSDVESMDTVSVTLSDYHGTAHSSNSKKPSNESSGVCLCDGQGTWPFSHCSNCGRQFYGSSSLGHQNGGRLQCQLSPVPHASDCANSFSPQWTMDASLASPTNGETCPNQKKKDFPSQKMQPLSDATSLCSHTSRSSSTSTASSSGSEYSVPRNYLEALYDQPRALLHFSENLSEAKNGAVASCSSAHSQKPIPAVGNHGRGPAEKMIVCPCHEPVDEWTNVDEESVRPQCSCWNQLSLSMRSEQEFCVTVASNQKGPSAKPSPPASLKKVPNAATSSTIRTNTVAVMSVTKSCTCNRNVRAEQPNAHYAVPRSVLANMYMKEMAERKVNVKRVTENPLPAALSEEYDVPKKFADILVNSEMPLKSPLKVVEGDSVCKCTSSKGSPSHSPLKEAAHHEIVHHYERSTSEAIQICTCQRVMLWAGSFVPCLGGSSKNTLEPGWQCSKLIGYPSINARAIPNHYGTICCEPPRTAEVILRDGKPKHILCTPRIMEADLGSNAKHETGEHNLCKTPTTPQSLKVKSSNAESNSEESSSPNDKRTCTTTNANYENLEFAQSLPLYENSNAVLNRLEPGQVECSTEKPPLPPRGRASPADSSSTQHSLGAERSLKQCTRLCSHTKSFRATSEEKMNSGAYELMSFEKQSTAPDEDYLLMQPVYHDKNVECDGSEKESQVDTSTTKSHNISDCVEDVELPLRPFMPFSYPHLGSNEDEMPNTSASAAILPPSGSKYSDAMLRRYRLINEDADLRSTRSNSLSELKKIVLLRKRSSSVDGKTSIPSSGYRIQSNPGSPINTARVLSQRNAHKSSLFSKLSLRSKEKSMSTNEIIPQIDLPSAAHILNSDRRNNLHRSADCLKLNEEYTNSDDDISNDHSEASVKETATMKRSSSVPCPSALPGHLTSPRTNNVSAIPELNDLNKDSNIACGVENFEGYFERETKPDVHIYSERASHKSAQNACDKARYDTSSEGGYVKTDSQAATSRSRNQSNAGHVESILVLDPYKSSSSSSSDISDFIESLSHCSRSSSSSSGSSSEYMRSEDLYPHKFGCKPTFLKISNQGQSSAQAHRSPNICCHVKSAGGECQCQNYSAHASSLKHIVESSENSRAEIGMQVEACEFESSQNCSVSVASENDDGKIINSSVAGTKASLPVAIPNSSCHCVISGKLVNGSRKTRNSRSSTSSSSSFSSSPSAADYSSSSSGNGSLPATVIMNISEKDRTNDRMRCGSCHKAKNVCAGQSHVGGNENGRNADGSTASGRKENTYM